MLRVEMISVGRLWLFRLAVLTALSGSALKVAGPVLSGACRGCAVKAVLLLGGWAVPLAALGVLATGALLALSYCRGDAAVRLRKGLALGAGGVGLGLLLVQAVVLQAFCPVCCVLDVALLLAAVADY